MTHHGLVFEVESGARREAGKGLFSHGSFGAGLGALWSSYPFFLEGDYRVDLGINALSGIHSTVHGRLGLYCCLEARK